MITIKFCFFFRFDMLNSSVYNNNKKIVDVKEKLKLPFLYLQQILHNNKKINDIKFKESSFILS